MIERIPPHNEEAERSVLGAVMLNKDILSEVLEEVSEDEIDEREKYWINKENSLVPNGYNIDKGGQGQHNTKPVD